MADLSSDKLMNLKNEIMQNKKKRKEQEKQNKDKLLD